MDSSHLRNQEELVRDFATHHSFDKEETEREEVRMRAARKLHLLDKSQLTEILLLICKYRPVLTEIIWSLEDEDGELIIDKQKGTRFTDKTLETIHIQSEARLRIANLLASHILQEDVVAVHFRSGERYLEVVKGVRQEGQLGKVLISSVNPFAY